MTDPSIELLAALVAVDSVNPSLVEGGAGEAAIAALLAARMRAIGLGVHVQNVAPGRPNVIGVLEGEAPGPSLLLCGHSDTVGVDGMASPFTPVLRSGRLYGRGAQDMKGGLAAMVDAARVVGERGLRRGRLIVAAIVDEEFASLGADALVRDWRADAAVVTEPTDLQMAVAHKGFAWFEIETKGRAAHGSRPAEGSDAVLRMGRVLARLEALDRELQSKTPHPLMGCASLHASTIRGGREWSMYPDACVLQVERRTIAGESVRTGEEELDRILRALTNEDPSFDASTRTVFSRPPYETPADHPLIDALTRAIRGHGLEGRSTAMTFWTDAAVLGEAGIPSVLFGPGGAGLHSTEEYVNIGEVIACRDVLVTLAERWLGAP